MPERAANSDEVSAPAFAMALNKPARSPTISNAPASAVLTSPTSFNMNAFDFCLSTVYPLSNV
jgi:hypothetical protein